MTYHMYVSISQEDRVSRFAMDPETGRLEPNGDVPIAGRPAPMAVDPDRRYLYVGLRGIPAVSSFRIDPATGDLSLLGTAALESDPCYLATDRTGRFLLSAYYFSGNAAVHPIDAGVVGTPPIEWLDTAPGAHSIQTDRANRFAFVPHIAGSHGPNEIFLYKFDERTGHLTPNSPSKVLPEPGVGPRHFCFHPTRDVLYFSNEQGCSVTAYDFDSTTGALSHTQTVSTLPDGYEGSNTCAQIQITPSGRYLYAPNRGHNSIACFSIDAATGRLTAVDRVPTEPIPRAIGLDPSGKFLFAAGLDSGRLASYRIVEDTGRLDPLDVRPVGKEPMWVSIVRLG